MINLAEMLRLTVKRNPDKEALVFGQARLTWGEFYARAYCLSRRLAQTGIRRQEVAGIYAPHSLGQAVAIFAAAMCDAVFSIISPHLKENQIKHQIGDTDMAALIGTPEMLARLSELASHRSMGMVEMDELGLESEGESGPPPDLDKPLACSVPTDVGCLIYTSGSSGRAKGVVVPQRTLLDGARIVSDYLQIGPEDVTLGMLPFSFDYGLNQLLTTVYQGGCLVMHRFTFPSNLVQLLEEEGVTGMAAVPSLWPNILNPRFVDRRTKPEFAKLRYVTTAGGIHTRELLRSLQEFFPHSGIIVMYGLTESFRSCWLPPSETFKRPSSIGKPVPGVEIRVINDQGEDCAHGEKGELIHRGVFVTYGYLNNPDLTRERFIELGTGGPGCLPEYAVRSGDLVHMDEDGYLYFHGRKDMQIKSAGFRVSPGEVEEAALTFKGISQAAAFARPNAELGQQVCLAYTTYAGKAVDEAGLKAHLHETLPYYAAPQSIYFYKALPLTAHGKINYPVLMDSAAENA